MPDYPHLLSILSAGQTATIQRHILDNGEHVWIRKAGKTIPAWRYRLLGLVAGSLNLGALQPVPNPGGRLALENEARRLQTLGEAGVQVPRLLAQNPDALMFSHLGEHTLLSEIENAPQQTAVWQEGLTAIADLHARGQYLSQAFARNIIRSGDGSIGFIDFEDDPGLQLDLIACQSRDYLCYLQSTALWLKRRQNLPTAARLWQTHLSGLPHNLHTSLQQTCRKTQWLRHLQQEWMGNDTLRLSALAELNHLAQAQ